MIKNYIKIAWRNVRKNKFFSIINVFGFSVGLACCMLIALYLHYESSYDSYHKNINNLYQVGTTFVKSGEKDDPEPTTPAPMSAALKHDFPEIIESTRLLGLFEDDKTLLQYNQPDGQSKSFLEENGYLADPSFFKMFTYDFIEGNPTIALSSPNTVVLSEQIGRKIFGELSPLNKVIHVNSNTNGEHNFRVTGVFRPVSTPSHINASFFLSFAGGNIEQFSKKHETDFANNNMFYTYILLKPGVDPAKFENKLPAFIEKYAGNNLRQTGSLKKQFLVPVKKIHLNTNFRSNVTPPASRTYLYVLASIAIFTLLIACINFMNLSTARSSKRSSEVGVRKVLGAERGSLVRQFLGESILMTLVAFVVAVLMAILFLPVFNKVSGSQITISFSQDGGLFTGLLLMALVTGFIAGIYPAFYLSSFNPVKVLKGKLTNSLAVVSIRKGLVVLQFVISVALIIASVVIARQMQYMRSADLGFAKDQQIVIPIRSAVSTAMYPAFENEIRQNDQVISVGASAYYPGIFNAADPGFYKDGQTRSEAKRTRLNLVDEDFLRTLDFKAVSGRLFSAQFKSDTGNRIIVNEAAIKELGFGSAPKAIGQNIHTNPHGTPISFEIVGVVKDFHFEDLHVVVKPYAFKLITDKSAFNYLVIHVKAGNMGAKLKQIENAWNRYNPNEPFDYTFLDDEFQKNYAADNRLAAIVGYFTAIAILVSCLGLFGLAAFSAEQRTKEIGVRKVLGASVSSIVSLLCVDFLRLIIISIIIASPVAWLVMTKWLQSFAYRRAIDWTIFAYSTILAIVISFLTIGSQAIKASIANPVKNLKSE
jgi:putative ABC transport system permease protein